MSRGGSCRVRTIAVLAVSACLACWLPSIAAAAGPPHAVHFGGHFGGGRFGGGRFAPHPPARGFAGGRFAPHPPVRGFAGGHGPVRAWGGRPWHGGPGGEGRWHAGFRPHGNWHGGGAGHWHAGGWRGDRWRGGDWDGRWGGGWDDRYWTGRVWLGGDWGGAYWPPVDYDWDYPWFLPAVPYGAVTIWFGNVPYYYVNQVYYAWNPSYDGYVVTDPPPVAARAPGSAGIASSPGQAGQGIGVLSLRVIPLKGQSKQQTANDQYACNEWAVSQSGFNPLSSAQDAHASLTSRDDYRRALTACLNARGYSVRNSSR